MGLTVLIPGAGARENAWAWKLAQSPRVGKIYCAPGTPGTAQFAENVQIPPTSIDRLARFAERRSIDLTVVGREDLLGLGIVNTFRARGLRIFGPTRAAAEIETDKALAKFMMSVSGIPTGTFRVFSRYDEAVVYVVECFTHTPGLTLFIKASGLASGKGAYRCETLEKAQEALWKIMVGRVHQDAGDNVLVEECIPGQEISIHALADGKSSILFPPADQCMPIPVSNSGFGNESKLPFSTTALLLVFCCCLEKKRVNGRETRTIRRRNPILGAASFCQS